MPAHQHRSFVDPHYPYYIFLKGNGKAIHEGESNQGLTAILSDLANSVLCEGVYEVVSMRGGRTYKREFHIVRELPIPPPPPPVRRVRWT